MSKENKVWRALSGIVNTIICGEAARILAGFPDDCIDLTVTSPPY